ncbi:glycosyltransferase family protein [Convivina praedatoris]|uniref:Membrane protein 6-pyruvoyl-tetrahydropterin synthase-related domain-containing protein n=1 Tax=Convivina praedatoris TaxID=2880963 RepID=A0ABN8H9S0_9LACO|nr:hypothetical protein [Convivina sp. LMG 32447]CAH1850353.1 hypothetical protein R077815_00115 [Convivina sp. LMG 32447]CAH1850360.1 hypothetical protein LMG032447_00117 [Convivina sp. LMG 32447]
MIKKKMVYYYLLNFIFILSLAFLSTFIVFKGHFYNLSTDGLYHLSRFENIYQALKFRELPSLFNFSYVSVNSFAGVAINGMYPWLTGILFIIPRFIFNNPLMAFAGGFFLLNIITIINSNFLMSEITSNRFLIYTGTIIYQFNNFHFIDLYSRTAIGEALGYAFFPLVVLGLLQIHKNKKMGIWTLGIGMGLLANSHILSLVFATIFVIIFEIIKVITRKFNFKILLQLLYAAIISFLVGFYSLYNIISIFINAKLIGPGRGIAGMIPSAAFQALLDNSMAEHDAWTIGLPSFILLITLTILYFFEGNLKWAGWIVASDVILLLMMDWLPWQILVSTFISNFQFLSRFTIFIVLFLAIGFISYCAHNKGKLRISNLLILNCLIISFSVAGIYQFHKSYLGEQTYHHALTSTNYYQLMGKIPTFADYLPINKVDNKPAINSEIKFKRASVTSKDINSISFKVNSLDDETVVLPAVMYDNYKYKVTVDGIIVTNLSNNLLKVDLSRGHHIVKLESESSRNYVPFAISITSMLFVCLKIILLTKDKSV